MTVTKRVAMEHIFIDLDKAFYAPEIAFTLHDLIMIGDYEWPQDATCLTQECDGEIIWWSAPVEEVVSARLRANLDDGLIPLIGLGQQTDSNYFHFRGQAVTASDWQKAVVTLEQIEEAPIYGRIR